MSSPVVIADFGVGNLRSIQKMFERAGVRALITADPETVLNAARIVLPGVGNFGATMSAFRGSGLEEPLRSAVFSKGAALLGVCVGAQMLMSYGEEGDVPGLDFVPGRVVQFRFDHNDGSFSDRLKIPHMGWRTLQIKHRSALFEEGSSPRFYFTHSYFPEPQDCADTLATAWYGCEFTAMFSRGRIWGAQFHPEKSHVFGVELLSRFAKI